MQIYKKELRLFRWLLLLCVPMLALSILLPKRAEDKNEEEGRYVLCLSEVDEALQPHLHVGDRVVDRQKRCILGDILEIRAEESRREVFSETAGALVSSPVPGRYDIFLTVSAQKKDGICRTASGDVLLLGQTYHFRTYDFTGTGRVVALL